MADLDNLYTEWINTKIEYVSDPIASVSGIGRHSEMTKGSLALVVLDQYINSVHVIWL